MAYFSSVRLYTDLQTGEILFRPRLGPASVGPQAAIWYTRHLVLGMLCVADGASVPRRMSARVSTPDPDDQSLLEPQRRWIKGLAQALNFHLNAGQSQRGRGDRSQRPSHTKPPQRASLQ
ncbi:hypothetical protein [Xanthomonas nasturtii]|uniref:hypothetical protein n=1 Tax=Xanthomonas nasturtii TaxID=1843581 RepID=UPI002B22F3DA|nr:hypothetical protein [Xanthomonas nasturtii]